MVTNKKRNKDGWLRLKDNKMKWYGDIDEEKKTIRVNKSKKKNKKKGDIIDTIVHEEMHKTNPNMYEKTVRKQTKKKLKRMSQNQKKKLYLTYREGGR